MWIAPADGFYNPFNFDFRRRIKETSDRMVRLRRECCA
jgi:hypothetical protein